jgi:hypothetical protein
MHATERTSTLEKLFSSLLQTERGSTAYRETLEKVRASLTDPRIPTRFTVLSEESPAVAEAYAVSDALESVTNGMYDPEALSGIAEMTEDSPLYYWQRLVYALIAFYQGDRDNMHQLLEEIPDGVPPASLKEVLFHLTGVRPIAEPSKEQRELIRRVQEDHSFIRSAVSQLKEYLENGMEETFAETAALLIKDLAFTHPEVARRLALTCMQAGGEDALTLFAEQLQLIFGEAEGNRLVALALMGESPDVSILFWIRLVLRSLMEDDPSRETVDAHLSIVGELAARVLDELPSEELEETGLSEEEAGEADYGGYFERLALLTRKLEDELGRRFPNEESSSIDPLQSPLRRLAEFSLGSEPHEREPAQGGETVPGGESTAGKPSGKRRNGETDRKAVQLELF